MSMSMSMSMSKRTACPNCPFRVGSPLKYDADAAECLDNGETPACHSKVGLDAIFHHAPMDPPAGKVCLGYEAWVREEPGFARPRMLR